MAAPTALTLLDLAKRTHNNKISDVAEVLTEKIPMFQMLPFIEASDINSHLITRRGSEPEGTWRRLNAGVAPSKSDVIQVEERVGLLESWSEIDLEEAKMSGNINGYRNMEDRAHVAGMAKQLEEAIFYQTVASNINSFNGLDQRYGSLSTNVVFDGGNNTDDSCASAWICELGPQGLFGIYSKGTKAGIEVDPKAVMTKTDSSGGLYDVLRTKFVIRIGLGIRDTRSVKRVANITLTEDGVITALDYIRAAINRMPGNGRPAIFVSPTTMDLLERVADSKTNVNYGPDDPFGNTVLKFKGVHIYKSDSLLDTEDDLV